MNKRTRLQQILQVLDPSKGTRVDFAEFDTEVAKLKAALTFKIQGATIEDVNNQLEQFKKKLDLAGLLTAVNNLETTLDQRIAGVSGSLNSEVAVLKRLLSQKSNATEVSTVTSQIELLKGQLADLTKQKNEDLVEIKNQTLELENLKSQLQTLVENSQTEIEAKVLEKRDLDKTLTEFRVDILNRLNNLGGGSMNRQILFNGTDQLTRYTDINWKAGSNVTFNISNNDTAKRVDVTVAATGGSGSGITRSIATTVVSSTVGAVSTTDYVILANGGVQVTLPTAVGNTNLYTIKNIGTSSVLVGTTSAQTIDGQPTLIMPVQYTSVDLISDSNNWEIT